MERIKIDSPPPFWLPKVIDSLNSLLALAGNWDSYGARKISVEAVLASIQILHFVMKDRTPLPSVVPVPSGNVQLEWHKFDIDLEVEVAPSGNYSISYEDETGKTEPYEDNSFNRSAHDLQLLSGFINQITQRATGSVCDR